MLRKSCVFIDTYCAAVNMKSRIMPPFQEEGFDHIWLPYFGQMCIPVSTKISYSGEERFILVSFKSGKKIPIGQKILHSSGPNKCCEQFPVTS